MKLIKIALLFFLISFSGFAFAVNDDKPTAYAKCYAAIQPNSTFDYECFSTPYNATLNQFQIYYRPKSGGNWSVISSPTWIWELPCTDTTKTYDEATHTCITPPINCGANEYNDGTANGGVCLPIPDCNLSSPTGGNFFNVTTRQCETVSPISLCISDINTKYCPPIDDCKPAGYICSDEPNQKAIEDAARASAIAAAAASAAEKKAQLDEIAAAAAAAAATKASETQAAKDALQAAKDALAAAKASGDQAAIAAAVKEYGKALTAANDAAARQANSQAASDGVRQTNIDAGNEQAQIPSSNPGNAAAHDENIGDRIPSAITGLTDAISGDGSGTGRGSGVTTSTSQTSVDTSGLATDATAKGIEGNTKGILDALTKGTKGTLATAPDSFYTSEYPDGISGVWDSHKTAISQTPFMNAVAGLTPAVGESGSLPSWTLPPVPFISSASHEFQTFPEMWGFLRIVFIITALFTARSLVFGG